MALNNLIFLFHIPTVLFFLAAFSCTQANLGRLKNTIRLGTIAIVSSILLSVFGAFWLYHNGPTHTLFAKHGFFYLQLTEKRF
jgi:uncharacterized BrkB/YihY/UPF0761 family membrane protein